MRVQMTNDEGRAGARRSARAAAWLAQSRLISRSGPARAERCALPFGSDSRVSAFLLMECLAYLVVFFVVSGLAFAAYHQMDGQSRALTRNSEDIVRALRAGERWRADVRAATNAIQLQEHQEFRLATRHGLVSYFFRDGAVWRQDTNDALSQLFLASVQTSAMQPDARTQLTAWRWEVELKTKRTNATTRPLFTFLAAPGTEAAR